MKLKRHYKIIDLIKSQAVETQEELAELLNKSGFQVTQATVSRDIRELKLTKITESDGTQRYAVSNSVDIEITMKRKRVFRDGVVSFVVSGNILVIKTLEGMAMAVAASVDAMGFGEIIGTIAGDDVVMCVLRMEADSELLTEKLERIMNE